MLFLDIQTLKKYKYLKYIQCGQLFVQSAIQSYRIVFKTAFRGNENEKYKIKTFGPWQ